MNKKIAVVARTASELGDVLGLSPSQVVEMEIRVELNDQIIRIARRKRMTHAQIAKGAGASRTRVTAILNRNTQDVSTDLMLRILVALGYTAKLTVVRSRPAA